MALTIDQGLMTGSTPPGAAAAVNLPVAERLRIAHRRHRRAGTHELLVSAGFTLAAFGVVAIALFSLIGR